MTTKPETLRTKTIVLADTGDLEAVRYLKPMNCATNRPIVPKTTINEVIARGVRLNANALACIGAIADRLAASVGTALKSKGSLHLSVASPKIWRNFATSCARNQQCGNKPRWLVCSRDKPLKRGRFSRHVSERAGG